MKHYIEGHTEGHTEAHTEDRGVEKKGTDLDGMHLALGVCGGIGATEVVKITREFRRFGATVTVFTTPSALQFITETSLEWGSNQKIIKEATAGVEHLDPFDGVIVAPATWNCMAKCAAGISDNAVTLLVSGQLGRKKPVIFVPTMNIQLKNHPLYGQVVRTLLSWGVQFFESPEEEDRLKMPAPEALVRYVKQYVTHA